MAVHYVRKVGNNAAHLVDVSKREAFFALLNIYNVVGAVLLKLRVVDEVKPFDKTLIPNYVQKPVMVPTEVPMESEMMHVARKTPASTILAGNRERVRFTVASMAPMYLAPWAKAPARMKIHTIIMMLLCAAPRENLSIRSENRRGRQTTNAQAQAAMKAVVTGIL